MSSVLVHVGQAGCQLAAALWPPLARERPGSPDLFARHASGGPPRPRAVLVDGEPKVVEALLRAAPGAEYAFDSASAAWSQSGRGGNFAMGYSQAGPSSEGSAERSQLLDRALECVRRQVEGCHGAHLGSVVFHSLGGGTGSGLGARLVEELRDAYPRAPLLTASVLPLAAGENPAQAYNAVLSLSALQELADAVILYENDRLMAGVEATAPRGDASAVPAPADLAGWHGGSLAAMNGLVAQDLVPFLCPPQSSQPFDPGELLASVCPMPTHHFAQAFSGEALAPHGLATELKAAVGSLSRSAPRVQRASVGGGSLLAGQAIVRGFQVPDAKSLRGELLDRFGGAAPWQPFGLDLRASPSPLRSASSAVRVAAVVNWKRAAQVVKAVADRAQRKYASRAFAHWYDTHGFGRDAFEHAFEVLETVAANYDAA